MTDKNGRIIKEDSKCIINGKLGIITQIRKDKVSVLMLIENGEQCFEQEYDPKDIEVKL